MTIVQDHTAPAWLDAAISRRTRADMDEQQKRRAGAAAQAGIINARLNELGITPVEGAHWTPGGYLVHARLIRPYALGEEWGATAGLHDGVVSVFVDSGDGDYPALTKHAYVGPLTSTDDVLNAVYSGPPKQQAAPTDHEGEAEHHLQRADRSERGSDDESHHLRTAHAHAILATLTDRKVLADLRYRLAAIERLIAPVATSQMDSITSSLIASAIHEIARGARTPEDALTLLPPEWCTALSGLTR